MKFLPRRSAAFAYSDFGPVRSSPIPRTRKLDTFLFIVDEGRSSFTFRSVCSLFLQESSETNQALETPGETYYSFRAQLMADRNEDSPKPIIVSILVSKRT